MPIFIRDSDLDADLDRIAAGAPARTSRHAIASAILKRVVALCSVDPSAWTRIAVDGAPVPPEIRGDTDPTTTPKGLV